MLYITLDEYGNFEDKDSMPVYIAGLIYDDKGDKSDLEDEKTRISDYYNKVIQLAKNKYKNECQEKQKEPDIKILEMFKYPNALHYNNSLGNEPKSVVGSVKNLVGQTIGEFITDCKFQGIHLIISVRSRLNIKTTHILLWRKHFRALAFCNQIRILLL